MLDKASNRPVEVQARTRFAWILPLPIGQPGNIACPDETLDHQASTAIYLQGSGQSS